ncbi:MAG: MFS transporter [Planctomycetota bacterium]
MSTTTTSNVSASSAHAEESKTSAIAFSDRVALRTKVAAGTGEAVINIGINIPKNFSFLIYNIVLGVTPTLLGIALFIPRIWDAFLDPLMGAISDNTRSRFGRRRPYMLMGGVMTAAGIGLLCVFPRGMHEVLPGQIWGIDRSDLFYAGYLMAVSMVFYTFMTVFAVPYGALTMEITRDYSERTRVMSFRTLFTYASGLLIGWLYAIAEADWDLLTDPTTGEPDPIRGSYAIGALLVVVVLVCALVPTLLVCEPKQAVTARPRTPVLRGLAITLKGRAFLLCVGPRLAATGGCALRMARTRAGNYRISWEIARTGSSESRTLIYSDSFSTARRFSSRAACCSTRFSFRG